MQEEKAKRDTPSMRMSLRLAALASRVGPVEWTAPMMAGGKTVGYTAEFRNGARRASLTVHSDGGIRVGFDLPGQAPVRWVPSNDVEVQIMRLRTYLGWGD